MSEDTKPDQPGTQQLKIQEEGVEITHCDFWVLAATPEEFVIRFADTRDSSPNGVRVRHKVVLNPYATKRLAGTLYNTLKEYERTLDSLKLGADEGGKP